MKHNYLIGFVISKLGELKLELEELGWDEHFQTQKDSLGLKDIIPGRVFRISPTGICEIYTSTSEITARIPGRLKKDVQTGTELPVIGDWVLIKPLEIGNMIFKVLERKNQISRKAAGKEMREQLVAANIDIIFLVMGLDNDYNLRRLERFIFMVTASSSTPVIVLNKIDLVDDVVEKERKVLDIVGNDIPVHTTSALTNNGIDPIRHYLKPGITIALVGSSGVGKSTIINTLLGEDRLKTADVREKDSKGRHITTTRELILIPGGGVMVDNPGIRELQLWGTQGSLQGAFKDIEELSIHCKFSDCAHLIEPNCAVTKALETGALSQQRYNNYQKMKKELAYLNTKVDVGAEAAKRKKWKGIIKNAKYYRKYKENRD